MKPKFVLSFLRIATNILMWVLIVFTGFLLCVSIFNIVGNDKDRKLSGKNYVYEMTAFGEGQAEQPYLYAADSLVRYRTMANRYSVEIEPNSAIGYYTPVGYNTSFGVNYQYRKWYYNRTDHLDHCHCIPERNCFAGRKCINRLNYGNNR